MLENITPGSKSTIKMQISNVDIMGKEASLDNLAENRSVSRNILDKFFSVQFSLNDRGPVYLFKLRDKSTNEPCILVKEDSCVSEQLEVGDILYMEYSSPGLSNPNTLLKTKIISKNSYDRVTGHFLVGLSIVDEQRQRL
jgi:hypothetical protein